MFRKTGQTVWACCSADGQAGMAWDWVELQEGVIAMANPMAISTNLRLMDPGGALLGHFEALRHLHTVVHALPWQGAVEQHLQPPGPPALHPDAAVGAQAIPPASLAGSGLRPRPLPTPAPLPH